MRKVSIRKVGSVRLTSAATPLYGACGGISVVIHSS
jgi:hypothetical protein